MLQKMKRHLSHRSLLCWVSLTLAVAGSFVSPAPAASSIKLLKEIIINYNQEALKESLIDQSHRGEEGILRIRPEIGKALGMKVFMDQDYLEAKELFEKSDTFLEKAEMSLRSEKKERVPGEHIRDVAEYFLSHQRSLEAAREKLLIYRSRLNPKIDERLDETVSARVMERLMAQTLKQSDSILREALGRFFNICQGVDKDSEPVTPENVAFVNYVFHRYTRRATKKALSMLDLDRDDGYRHVTPTVDWKKVVENKALPYIPPFEAALKRLGNKIYRIDPLLFFALMKRESSFNHLAVSPVGAVGLTQIMPRTGKDLGMKHIYEPLYFGKATSLLKRERRAKEQALTALNAITEANKGSQAKKARELMQTSLKLGKKREKLFLRYKRELLRRRTDDRLNPSLAIEYGLRYFTRLMKAQRGDMSLALASYNAGPKRVRTYQGIPPFEETVLFRNRVLGYYRDYLKKAVGGSIRASSRSN